MILHVSVQIFIYQSKKKILCFVFILSIISLSELVGVTTSICKHAQPIVHAFCPSNPICNTSVEYIFKYQPCSKIDYIQDTWNKNKSIVEIFFCE